MSKIHILKSNGNFSYEIVIHFPTPIGNNSVGLSWKSCALANADIGSTILSVGIDSGNITPAEYDSIIAGDIVEVCATISPGLDPTNVAVEAVADLCINEWKARMASILKYYGHTIEGT